MANFTLAQAEACSLDRCESATLSAVHQHYVFGVTDPDTERAYKWIDAVLAAGSTAAQIKTAITDHLQTITKEAAEAAVVVSPDQVNVGGPVSDVL